MNLRDLPIDPRGFLVPAEAPWSDQGPHLAETDSLLKIVLAAYRACGVCGFPMPRDEPVWRIYDTFSRKETLKQIAGTAITDFDVPGHLVCMLYSALVCPYWRTSGARLSKASMFAPGSARGPEPSIMAFRDFAALIDPAAWLGASDGQPAYFLLRDYQGEIRFDAPIEDLTARYEQERLRVGGRYAKGKRWHWAPQFGGAKRLTNDAELMVTITRSEGPVGTVDFEHRPHGVFPSGWGSQRQS